MDYLSLVAIVLVFGVMYAVLIIPQRKREKKTREMLNALKVDDHILTIGGISGVVRNINEDDVTIETGVLRTQILIKKWAVRSVETPTTEG
ncbi:MAG: preprotein translocase subunit YajC [Clostridia bacterium]